MAVSWIGMVMSFAHYRMDGPRERARSSTPVTSNWIFRSTSLPNSFRDHQSGQRRWGGVLAQGRGGRRGIGSTAVNDDDDDHRGGMAAWEGSGSGSSNRKDREGGGGGEEEEEEDGGYGHRRTT